MKKPSPQKFYQASIYEVQGASRILDEARSLVAMVNEVNRQLEDQGFQPIADGEEVLIRPENVRSMLVDSGGYVARFPRATKDGAPAVIDIFTRCLL